MSSRLRKRLHLLAQAGPSSSTDFQDMCKQAAGSSMASLRLRLESAARYGIVYLAQRAPYGTSGYVISKDGNLLSIESPSHGHIMPVAWCDRREAEKIAEHLGGVAVYGAGTTWRGDEVVRKGGSLKFGNRGGLVHVPTFTS